MKTSIRGIAFIVTLLATCGASSAQGTIPLASRLPAVAASNDLSQRRSSISDIFTGQDGNKAVYNLQLLAVAGAVASDDTGIHRTLYMAPGSTGYRVSSDITKLGDLTYTAPLLGAVYLTGGHGNQTLATDAAIAIFKAGVVGTILKYGVGRHRPSGASGDNNADAFSPGSAEDADNSFPSGHSLVAFSVASVWAHDKPKEKFLAYGLATLVGLSRITLSAHWATDVLAGAALGIAQGRQVDNGNTNLLSIRF